MDLIIQAVKTDLSNCLSAGQTMLVSLFAVAVFVRYVGLLSHQVNWAEVIVRLVIGFVLLQNYTLIMDTTRTIVSDVDSTINPTQDYVSQYATMSQNIQQRQQSMTRQSILTQIGNGFFGPFSLHNIIINLSFIAYAILSKIMEAVRYSMTAILYKIGPVLIPLVLFQSTGQLVKGWYISYVSVLCWPILWHIVLGIAVNLSNQQTASGSIVEQFAAINFAVCFVLVFSPFIINSLVSGIGAGSSAGMAGLMTSTSTGNVMTGAGHFGFKSTSAFIGEKFIKNSTILPGKFKNFMMGDDKGDVKP
jgi:TrbL/VirB6 plasmid conjugal transfer protein